MKSRRAMFSWIPEGGLGRKPALTVHRQESTVWVHPCPLLSEPTETALVPL